MRNASVLPKRRPKENPVIQDEAHNRPRPGCRNGKVSKTQRRIWLDPACPSNGRLELVVNDEERCILAHRTENRRREALASMISITDIILKKPDLQPALTRYKPRKPSCFQVLVRQSIGPL